MKQKFERMKRWCFMMALVGSFWGGISAQTIPLHWHSLSFDRDSVYGLELDKAYEYLKTKERKQKVIVAVIDGGFDVQHEALREAVWTNPKDVAGNGVDDDRNGYTDDVHGWNFLVTKEGKPVVQTMDEAAKLFLQKKERFEALFDKQRSKKEEQEYQSIKELMKQSEVGKKYAGLWLARLFGKYLEDCDRSMREQFPGETLSEKHLTAVVEAMKKTDTLRRGACLYYRSIWKMQPRASWETIFAKRLEAEEKALKEFEALLKKQKDERQEVGDDPENLKDRGYGSPVLLTEHAEHGTHVAGIIGARGGKDSGVAGIVDDVELMLLGIVPQGDEYDKDVALAIRYAVDNGAKVINMSFGKSVSLHREWVSKALRYAEKKGVLLVHGAGNDHTDIDRKAFYPVKHISRRKAVGNFITVGASDAAGQPGIFSNYGSREVDVFAPGVGIYSTVSGGGMQKMDGTSMACPMVAGVAALLMTYYPELSAVQVRDILLRTAVTRKDEQVLKPQEPTLMRPRKRVPFTDLCVAGGIVNAYEAVKLADQMVKRK